MDGWADRIVVLKLRYMFVLLGFNRCLEVFLRSVIELTIDLSLVVDYRSSCMRQYVG